MFDGIGFMELLLIGILGLVVLGPERLPAAVRSITGWIRAMKRMANSVKDELEQELNIEQLHSDLKKAESQGLKNLSPELQESIDQLKEAAQSVNRPYGVDDITPDNHNGASATQSKSTSNGATTHNQQQSDPASKDDKVATKITDTKEING